MISEAVQVQLQENLRHNQADFARILDIANEAIISTDDSQRIIIFNKGAQRIFGYAADEILGQPLELLIPARLRARHRQHMANFAASATVARLMEERQAIVGRRKNGEEFPAEVSISKLELAGRQIFTAVLRDITDRARAEEALRESEAKNRALLNAIPDMMFRISQDGTYLDFKAAAGLEPFVPPSQFLGRTLFEVLPAEVAWEAMHYVGRALETGQTQFFEYQLPLKGNTYYYEARTVRSGVQADEALVIVRDITQRQQRDEELRHSRQQLRALSAHLLSVREEERQRISRAIHDQLGQALTGLKMDVAWLQRHLDPAQAALLEKTRAMSELIDRSVQSVRQIATELRPGVLDAIGLVAAIEWQLKEFEARSGIACRLVNHLEETSLNDDASTAAFRIFQEALTNVARHARASQLEVSLEETAEHFVLGLQDDGRGITASELHSPQSIGLLGMRERAWLRGGTLHIHATPGAGTSLTLRLPLDR